MFSANTIRLGIMMFLQFFIWGAWYVTAPLYLGRIGFTGTDFGWTYSVGPIAGILSPFLVGMIADRFFATERVLGVMHIMGGAAMLYATQLMQVDDPSPGMINLIFFCHMLCYYPTLALTNSLALQTMTNPEKQFPLIRVFGTIGWIIAGWVLSWQGWDASIDMFYLAGGAAVLMGVYSFALPHTPPPAAGEDFSIRQAFGLDALVLLKKPSFLVFMVSSFLICIPLAFYYQMAAKTVAQAELVPAFTMSMGQVSEILFMVIMPLFFAALGVKWMLAVGMLAWVIRYTLFAIGAPNDIMWMIITGVLLHGICYDFFFVTGQIYTDKAAPSNIRSQAQGMLVLFTLGLGMLIGAQIGGQVEQAYTPPRYGELQAESGAVAAAAGEHTKQLASTLFANSDPKDLFADIIAADRKVTGEAKSSAGFLSLFVASNEPPLEGYFQRADGAAEEVNEQIRQRRDDVANQIEQVEESLEKEKSELALADDADARSQALATALAAHLEAEAETEKEAIREGSEEELEALQNERIERYSQAAAALMQEKIDIYNSSASTKIPEELEPALLQAAQVESLTALGQQRNINALKAIQWQAIWTIPAVFAGVILLLFLFLFRDGGTKEPEVAANDAPSEPVS